MSPRGVRANVGKKAAAAPFALLGVIERLGATTMPIVAASESTGVLRVESVVRAPEALGELTGAEVTVDLDGPVEVGERLLLFAEPWMLGDSLAVREVARADPEAAESARGQLAREREEAPVRRLRERARGADAVVAGVVRELRPAERPADWVPTGEHDPEWWVAVIEVEDVAKGRRPRGGRLEALFANSRDVQWFAAAKPEPGQRGVFLLRREQRFGAPRGALAVLDPADLQPPEHYDEIRRSVEGGG